MNENEQIEFYYTLLNVRRSTIGMILATSSGHAVQLWNLQNPHSPEGAAMEACLAERIPKP